MPMKRVYLFALLLLIGATAAATSDYFLLPESFFLHKGDKLTARLFTGIQFSDNTDYEAPEATSSKFELFEGSKKIDVAAQATDTAVAIKDYTLQSQGLTLLHLTQPAAYADIDRETYTKHLDEEVQTEASKKANSGNTLNLKEKYTRYLKTLVMVDKNSGGAHDKVLGDEYEIILKNNPYKGNYGDDITAVVLFKGEPLPSAQVSLYIKSTKGIYPEKLVSDQQGQVYFKLSREGIYFLRALLTKPSATKDADFETWWASYSFAFSSTNELPNSYKEFGFGNLH